MARLSSATKPSAANRTKKATAFEKATLRKASKSKAAESESASRSKARMAEMQKQIAALTAENEKLLKRSRSRKIKLDKRATEIATLKAVLATKDSRLSELESDVALLEQEKMQAISQRDAAQTNLDILVGRMNGERDSFDHGRSPIRDSLAIVQDQARSSVETTVTTVRPQLRTPPKLKPIRS
jgi:chromosome segregation ATPase